MDIKILGNLLRETIDRGNLRIQKRIMVNLGLLKSGKVELRRTIDQGRKPEKTSWDTMQQVVPHREELLRTSSRRKCAFRKERRDYS